MSEASSEADVEDCVKKGNETVFPENRVANGERKQDDMKELTKSIEAIAPSSFTETQNLAQNITLSDFQYSNCTICLNALPTVKGIKLKNCDHFICHHCTWDMIQSSKENVVCRFRENHKVCGNQLNSLEVYEILRSIETNLTSNPQLGYPARKIESNGNTAFNMDLGIYFNYETFYCVLCTEECEPGNGIILQQCCHSVCTACIIKVIKRNSDVEIKCPFSRTLEECNGVMLHSEIRSLISEEEFSSFVDLSLKKHQPTTIDELMQLDDISGIENKDKFECPICLTEIINSGDGIILRNCFHTFCKACLVNTIDNSENTEIMCPFVDNDLKQCTELIEQREIKAVLPIMSFVKYLQRDLSHAELKIQNTFHCLTPNCQSFFIVETGDKHFICSVCQQNNCIECKAIHKGLTCAEHKDKIGGYTQQTMNYINDSVSQKQMMKCPNCQNYVLKNGGCNHMTCRCGKEFQWHGML